MKRCVLFDLDGTLVSTGGAGNRALDGAILELYDIAGAMENIDPAGKTDPAIIREIFRDRLKRECSDGEMKAVQEKYLELLPAECDDSARYRVMEGIPELLEALRKREALIGLGTGNLEKGARIKLNRAQLNAYLPFGGYGSDSENRAELLQVACRKAEQFCGCALEPENIFVIGDTEKDILAARGANLRMISVATGHMGPEKLKEFSPDFVFEDFKETERFLEIIFS